MLLGDWNDLEDDDAGALERDQSGYCVQEKQDGVRALLHITEDGVRITGRDVSEVTFRLSEFAANLPHLATGFEQMITSRNGVCQFAKSDSLSSTTPGGDAGCFATSKNLAADACPSQ